LLKRNESEICKYLIPESLVMQHPLDKYTKSSDLYVIEGDRMKCLACGHKCKIAEGKRGICRVRFRQNNQLMVPFGYFGAVQCDPIEKKPFFHAFPNTLAMSFGMLGCDFHCGYCQNWDISQVMRDKRADRNPQKITIEEFIEHAKRLGARSVVSTYNEPLITSEWATEIFKYARNEGLATGFVSNGHGTSEVIEFLSPHLDMYKVDLKCIQERGYRSLGGHLDAVLDTIREIHRKGIWLEIVTLLVPDFNDSKEEITQIAEFIKSVSKDIPWHVTGFHPDYKMTDRHATSGKELVDAVGIGQEVGLNFVYAGNRPGSVGDFESTFCPKCGELLVKRRSFQIFEYNLVNGNCPTCNTSIPGLWEDPPKRDFQILF